MDQMQNRRIAAVKAADAINAIEGVRFPIMPKRSLLVGQGEKSQISK